MVDLGERDGYRPVITSLMPGPFGQIWMTTLARGLLIMDRVSREWTPVGAAGSGQAGSLPRDAFMSLAMGPGQVFIGAWGSGVFRTPLEDAAFRLFNKSNLSGLSNNVISAVMATRRAGQPWLGSFGGGPQLADISGQFIRARPLRRHQMRESGVLSLAGPVQGRLYAGTSHGLYEFNPDGSQMALFAYRADNAAGIASGYVTALLPAGEDGLWVGLGGAGLQFFDARSQAFTAFPRSPNDPQGLKGNYVTALLDGPDGGIWVGTRSSGLNLCRVRPWSCEVFTAAGRPGDLTHDHVTSLYRDRSGEVWVATDGGGLNRVERGADGAISGFRAWRQSSGLLSDSILAIQEDVDGSLWLSGKGGISRLNPQTGRVVNFVAASGLPTSHFNADASAADERYLYFGSSDGLLVFEKGMQLSGRPSPRVLVTDVRHTDPGRYSLVERLSRRHFRIPYAEVFTVDLAVLDYSETSHRFAFRIQSDDDWTELGAQRRMIFHGLAPGLYEFQARGRDAHGTWGEAAPVTLEIVPPFWMTAWFRIGLALVVLTAGLFIHFGRQATLKRRAAAQLRLGEQREKALEQQLGGTSELAVLTPRQKEILQLIAQGHSTREIAELLGVSIKTVEAHRANLMERLEIRDVPGLVRLAIRANLVSLDD
jgi:DNA-binding CsgD family transcriptional regulator